jgi:hypothetical protein
LPGADFSVRVVVNADYTVDGQIMIRNLPDRMNTKQIIAAIESCVSPVANTWISVMLQFAPKTQADREELERAYARWKGLFHVSTNYQRNTHGKRPVNFRQAMTIAEKIELKGRQIMGISVRLHWNRADEKPERMSGEQGARDGERRPGSK